MSLRLSALACACAICAACASELSVRNPAYDPASPRAEETAAPKFNLNDPDPTLEPPAGPARTDQDAPAAPKRYTCPMHSEVQSAQPGSCPKCGMTLVPVPDGARGHR